MFNTTSDKENNPPLSEKSQTKPNDSQRTPSKPFAPQTTRKNKQGRAPWVDSNQRRPKKARHGFFSSPENQDKTIEKKQPASPDRSQMNAGEAPRTPPNKKLTASTRPPKINKRKRPRRRLQPLTLESSAVSEKDTRTVMAIENSLNDLTPLERGRRFVQESRNQDFLQSGIDASLNVPPGTPPGRIITVPTTPPKINKRKRPRPTEFSDGQRPKKKAEKNLFSDELMRDRLNGQLADIKKQLKIYNENNLLQNLVDQIKANQQTLAEQARMILNTELPPTISFGRQGRILQGLFCSGMQKKTRLVPLYCKLIATTFKQKDIIRQTLSIKTKLCGDLKNIGYAIKEMAILASSKGSIKQGFQTTGTETEKLKAIQKNMNAADVVLIKYLTTCSECLVKIAKKLHILKAPLNNHLMDKQIKDWFSVWSDKFGNSNCSDIQTSLGYHDHVRLLDTALEQFEQTPQAMLVCTR